MDKTEECLSRKRRQMGEKKQLSSSKVANNDDPIEEMMTELERISEDASVLFSRFPQEVWLQITDKVEDSETPTNLMRASPVFRNLLLPRRVEFLFPQVWQVLGWKFENQEDDVYHLGIDEPSPDSDHEGFSLDNPYIDPRTKILMLREVCKSWCRGVDEFYGDLPQHYTMQVDEDMEDDGHDVSRIESRTDFCRMITNGMGKWMHNEIFAGSIETVVSFMNQFDFTHFYDGDSHRNPIINRSISIYHKYGNGGGIFILLEKYGHHFWHFNLYMSNFPTRITFYTELKDLLQLLPNLKTLKVYSQLYWEFDQQTYTWAHKIKPSSEMEIHELEQEIASHPLPKLHQLQFLSVNNFPSWIFNTLLSANNHISMLEVKQDVVQEGYDFYSLPMPNLKQLSMKYFSKAEFEILIKSQVNWSLEKIYLDLRPCAFMPRSQIFSLLETKWAETLTNVAIFTPSTTGDSSDDINIVEDGSSTALNLPNVQRFLFSTQDISSLDFILPMKSLKFLQLALPKEIQFKEEIVNPLRLIQKNQVVQFVGYFNSFHKSNIWNLFPNLKSFKLGDAGETGFWVTYTREHYEGGADELIQFNGNKNLWYSD